MIERKRSAGTKGKKWREKEEEGEEEEEQASKKDDKYTHLACTSPSFLFFSNPNPRIWSICYC